MKNKIILLKFSLLFMLPSTLFSFHRINVKNIPKSSFTKKPNLLNVRFFKTPKIFAYFKAQKKMESEQSQINHSKQLSKGSEKFKSDHSEFNKLVNENNLPPIVYNIKAQEIIESIKPLNNDLLNFMEKFLEEQSQNFSKLEAHELDFDKTLKVLDSNWVYLFVRNYIDCNQSAKFLYQFALKANELLAYRLRKILKVYVTEVADFESEYASELNKVTEDEYNQKLAKLDKILIENLLIEEASKLADYILKHKFNID